MMAPPTLPPAAAVAASSPPPTEATPLSLRSDRSGSGHGRPPAPLSPTYHKWRRRLRLLLLLALIGLIVWAAVDYTAGPHVIQSGLHNFLAWMGRHPYAGAAAFLFVYAGCSVLFIPGSVLTLGGSFLFGHSLGAGKGFVFAFIAVFTGACLGAMASFLLGRFLLHADAQRLLQRYPAMLAIDRALHPSHIPAINGETSTGLKIMLLLRLSPLIPFSPLNYLMSLTSLGLRDYSLALIGMLPATAAYVFLGTSAGALAASSSSEEEGDNKADKTRGRVRIVLYALGAASLVLALALLSAHARRELRRLAPSVEEEGEGEGRQGEEEEEGERDDEMEQGGGRGGGGPRGAEEERK